MVIVRILINLLGSIDSVIDVGCGEGIWLTSWKKNGAKNVFGLDQIIWSREASLLGSHEFVSVDLDAYLRRTSNANSQKYDVCQCLEVAEHLDPKLSINLVSYLTSLSDIVIFSSAPPGQGGEHHINEKPYTWWKEIFEAHGFAMYDSIRPIIINNTSIMPWYKYNIFLFVSVHAGSNKVSNIRRSLTNYYAKGCSPPDLSPLFYQARKLILRNLPVKIQNKMAKFKYLLFVFNRGLNNHFRN